MSFYNYSDTELFYKEIGQGVPFLLIHGWAIDHAFLEKCFEPIFEKIDYPVRRIYVDIPGMGRSVPGKVKNGDGIIEVLGAFMDYIAPGQQYYVGGNSFGSVVSRAMVAKYADKIAGLMLIAPAADGKIPGSEEGVYVYESDFMRTLSKKQRDDFMAMNANLTRQTWERYVELVEPSVKINEHNDYMHKVLKGSFSFDINKMIMKNHFDKPTLILVGKYDCAVGYKEQFGWLSVFKKGSYILIDGAGHNIHIDQPEMFNDSVEGWLRQFVCISK